MLQTQQEDTVRLQTSEGMAVVSFGNRQPDQIAQLLANSQQRFQLSILRIMHLTN